MSAEEPRFELSRRLAAEGIGSAALVAAVIGSGIMATRLTGDVALALLCNSLATGAALVVLITLLGPVSGAHLNPVVSLIFALRRDMKRHEAALYAVAQCAGGIAGTMITHAMFALPLVTLSTTMRTGGGQWLSEGVASFGLVVTILMGLRFSRAALPWLVALFIVSAYWFTASTSFANPAVALARSLTDSFAGIRPADLPGFVLSECAGAVLALGFVHWLFRLKPTGFAPAHPRQQA